MEQLHVAHVKIVELTHENNTLRAQIDNTKREIAETDNELISLRHVVRNLFDISGNSESNEKENDSEPDQKSTLTSENNVTLLDCQSNSKILSLQTKNKRILKNKLKYRRSSSLYEELNVS